MTAADEQVAGDDRSHGVTLLYLIKQVELAVRAELDRVAGAHDLTAVQYTALTVLERHPDMTSAALARNSFVRAQTMAEMVTFLLDRGLVTRKRDPDNRRQYLLSLTRRDRRSSIASENRSRRSRSRWSRPSTVASSRSCAPT